jgi:hypothetical protein
MPVNDLRNFSSWTTKPSLCPPPPMQSPCFRCKTIMSVYTTCIYKNYGLLWCSYSISNIVDVIVVSSSFGIDRQAALGEIFVGIVLSTFAGNTFILLVAYKAYSLQSRLNVHKSGRRKVLPVQTVATNGNCLLRTFSTFVALESVQNNGCRCVNQ